MKRIFSAIRYFFTHFRPHYELREWDGDVINSHKEDFKWFKK
jgi:hypothetical protein